MLKEQKPEYREIDLSGIQVSDVLLVIIALGAVFFSFHLTAP